jgi:hypothetical protein
VFGDVRSSRESRGVADPWPSRVTGSGESAGEARPGLDVVRMVDGSLVLREVALKQLNGRGEPDEERSWPSLELGSPFTACTAHALGSEQSQSHHRPPTWTSYERQALSV